MPIVETLESYSRALLPLRAFVRRPFQAVADSFRLYGPRIIEMHRQLETVLLGTPFVLFDNPDRALSAEGAGSGVSSAAGSAGAAASLPSTPGVTGPGSRVLISQPSLLSYFTSSYALLMLFASLCMNRVNAIVAPRNPHPLKLSVRFALKIPALYLLVKAMLVTAALLATNNPLLPFDWPEALQTKMSIPSALFLCLSAMGTSFVTDTFIANIQNSAAGDQNFNMVEMSVMFHFTPQGNDILLVALIQVCQLLSLQVAGLFPRGQHYRLAITSLWGLMDMAHFAWAVYHRTITYPSMKLFTCIPEAGVIILLLVSLFVHGLTYLVTGGNVRRRMFEQRALPTSDDEYGVAVFKLGRACLEATRGIGFWNEVDAVVIPFGTILDKRQIRIATIPSTTGATDAPSSSPSTSTTEPNQRLWTSSFQHSSLFNPLVPSAGFSNEVPDVVDTPGHRQHISRRQSRLNSMRAFWQSTVLLLDGIYSAVYNKLAPARFPRRPRRIVIRPIATTMSTQEYLQLKMAIETAMEQAGRPASPDMQQEGHEGSALEGDLRMRRRWPHEAEDEERIYSRFLKESFSDENDEDYSDDEYIPPLDMEDEADSDVELGSQELQSSFGGQEALSEEQYDGLDVDGDSYEEEAEADENDEENAIVAQGSALGSLQDFLLDSSFLSIFLSGQGRDMPLTRSQHRRAIDNDARWDSDTTSDFEDHGRGSQRITGIRSRRTRTASHRRSNGDSSRQSLAQQENEGLLSLLQKYRKTSASLTAGSVNASAASSSSPMLAAEITSAQGPSTLSPPPMAEMPSNPEDSSLYPRLLCVVCQVEPRNILLRPCRCLALCNDCRELLAIRRFKQCPCCRSDVQGFSKIFLP